MNYYKNSNGDMIRVYWHGDAKACPNRLMHKKFTVVDWFSSRSCNGLVLKDSNDKKWYISTNALTHYLLKGGSIIDKVLCGYWRVRKIGDSYTLWCEDVDSISSNSEE